MTENPLQLIKEAMAASVEDRIAFLTRQKKELEVTRKPSTNAARRR